VRSARTGLAAVIAAAVALAAGTARADVARTPIVTGCATGYERLSIAALEESGPYPDNVFGGIDRAGNNNGYICGLAQPDAVRDAYCRQGAQIACELEQLGLPHYVLTDDDNAASTSRKKKSQALHRHCRGARYFSRLRKRPALQAFSSGRYWARTSDPQLVDPISRFVSGCGW